MTPANGTTTIRRLTFRGQPADALKVRRAVSQASWTPRGLPRCSILIVRRIADGLGRAGEFGRAGLRGPRFFERPARKTDVREEIESAARRAARPGLGPVPADAQAVLFSDPAELLAALAGDLADGTFTHHWWWRGYFGGSTGPAEAVVRQWIAKPRHAPAAISLLVERRQAAAFLRTLDGAATAAVRREIVDAFGLGEVARKHVLLLLFCASSTNREEPPSDPKAQVPASRRTRGKEFGSDTSGSTTAATPPADARLHDACRSELAALSNRPAAAALLALGWMLHRSPHLLPRALLRHIPVSRTATPAPRSSETNAAPEAAVHHETDQSGLPSVPPAYFGMGRPPRAAAHASAEGVARRGGTETPSAAAPVIPPRALAEDVCQVVETELGGVFFLLNLALYLGFYGDFSDPRAGQLDASPWELISRLGARLLAAPEMDASGPLVAPRKRDPVWPILERLAGDPPGGLPGNSVGFPSEWRLPPAWLKHLLATGAEPALWSYTLDGRLRVSHPAGYLLLDVPSNGIREEQVLRETLPYQGVVDVAPAPAGSVNRCQPVKQSPAERWLDWLEPYVRCRLRPALGESQPLGLARLLLRRRARVGLTPAHVNVTFELANHPVQLRVAGLDRDPGFVPAAGRSVAFHFV